MTAPALVERSTAPETVAPLVLPRVNLLPPEIEERRRFKQVQVGLGGAVAAAVGLVGLLYAGAATTVATAQDELDASTARGQQLRKAAAAYADVTAVYTRAAEARTMLTSAMGQEVRWSRFLNDLSLTVPDGVWIKGLTFTQTGGATGSAAAGAAPGAAGGSGSGLGSVSFTGVGFDHDDVAVWLESLARQKGYADPYLSKAEEVLIGDRKVVSFTSTVTVTDEALSRRYAATSGG